MSAILDNDLIVRWFLASVHLLALAIGVGAVFVRARALQAARFSSDLRPAFFADNLWGISGLLAIGTGLWRAFGGLEKGTAYYLDQPLFLAKMGLVVLVLLLEIAPMTALLRWRLALRRSESPDLSRAPRLARASYAQLVLLFLIVFLATAVARGVRI
jgi:putative membrane protein